jgi:hypothetical protein
MVNHDFFRDVMAEKKRLLPVACVRSVNVPKYEDISVKVLFPRMAKDKEFMLYMPNHMTAARLPSAEYFYSLLNTLYPELMKGLIDRANELRHKKTEDNAKEETIFCSEQWMTDLQEMPFSAGKRGRFVHLLKQGSRPVKMGRIKRKKEQMDEDTFFKLQKKSNVKKIVPVKISDGPSAM